MKVTILLMAMFALAMAAGVVTGRLLSRPLAPPQASGASSLADELQLSRDQQEQMRKYWEEARHTAQACAREAERIQRQHDEQLQKILTDEQKGEYERLSQANHQRIAEQDAKRQAAFHQAVNSTEKILRPDQRRAYLQIIKNHVGQVPGLAEQLAN
jgi:hypothetical protein